MAATAESTVEANNTLNTILQSEQTLNSASEQMSHLPDSEDTKSKGDDYVYFKRDPSEFSSDAVSRATAAKLKLGSYYKLAVDGAIERNARCVDSHP
jgi:protein-serine/threonine kinase